MRGKVIYFSLFLILLPLWAELIAQLSLYTCPIEPGEESSQEPKLEVRTFFFSETLSEEKYIQLTFINHQKEV